MFNFAQSWQEHGFGIESDFSPKIRFLPEDPGLCQWPVCSPRRYLRFGTFGSIFSGRSAARRVIFRPPGRIFARKSVFCYRIPDFVNGPFLALGDSFDLAPSDPFLNFSFPSYGNFREGDPPTQQKVLPHLTVGALTDSNSPSARSALALRARALRARAG